MDHMMPGMDGIEAVRIIREEIGSEYAKTVPVIALTANVSEGNESMFLERGFQDYLPKPIDVSALERILRKWVVR
jgi:CheY-like chemotaxis protein